MAPAAAETRTLRSGVPFCEVLSSFRSLIAAMLARDEAAAAHLDDCVFLKHGVRVEVLRSLVEIAPGTRIVAVRVYGHGTSVDGYTLSNGLEEGTAPRMAIASRAVTFPPNRRKASARPHS